jgi:hypothetical protein
MLGDALGQAAQSHALVVGLRPSQEFFEDMKEPLTQNKLESLRELETASLVLDSPASARPDEPLADLSLDPALNFRTSPRARPGLCGTLGFLKHLVGTLEFDDTPAELRPTRRRSAQLAPRRQLAAGGPSGASRRLLALDDKDVKSFEAAIRKAAAPKAQPPR